MSPLIAVRSRSLLLLALGVGLAPAPPARAQPSERPSIEIDWSAPPGCPDAAYVLAEIEHLLGAEATPTSEPVSVKAVVSPPPQSWSVHLETKIGDSGGERMFSADTCQRLAEAAALVVALAIRPGSVPEAPAAIPPPEPFPPPEAPGGLVARPFVAGQIGVLAKPSASVGVALGLFLGPIRSELQLAYGFSRRILRGPRPDTGADLQVPISADLRGCLTLLPGRLELAACAGLQGAQMRGTGLGITVPSRGSSMWLGLHGGAALSLRLWEPVYLRLETDLGLALSRPSFVIEPFGEVHRPSAGFGQAGLGVELHLP